MPKNRFKTRAEIEEGLSALLAAKLMIRHLDPEGLTIRAPLDRQLLAAIDLMQHAIHDPTQFELYHGRLLFEWKGNGVFCSAVISEGFIEAFYQDRDAKHTWMRVYHSNVDKQFINLLNENFGVTHEHQTKS